MPPRRSSAEAERRVGVLERLVERIDEARPRLEELATTITAATAEARRGHRPSRDAQRPGRTRRRGRGLADKVEAARGSWTQARKDLPPRRASSSEAEKATVDQPDRVALRERLTRLARRDRAGRAHRRPGAARRASAARSSPRPSPCARRPTRPTPPAQVAVVTAKDMDRRRSHRPRPRGRRRLSGVQQVVHDVPATATRPTWLPPSRPWPPRPRPCGPPTTPSGRPSGSWPRSPRS